MNDDGWKSRKLWLAVFTMALIFGGWIFSGRPTSTFGEMCMALIASAGIFSGSNVLEKLKKPTAP